MSEMNQRLPVDIKIASPCSAKWDEMSGSDTVRSCERCRHKVYNLSEMSAPDAAELIRKAEGRLCVRFYRRADGTVMTKDCPVGRRAVRARAARGIGIAFTSLLVWCGIGLTSKPRSEYPVLLRMLLDRIDPLPTEPKERPLMGMVLMPMAPNLSTLTPAPTTPEHTMGKPARFVDDKPFLHGAEVENNPRDDPFARQTSDARKTPK